jgi:DNA repair protein RadC
MATLKIKDMPQGERPRERLMVHGADALSAAELVAILLRTGRQGESVMDLAQKLLAKHASLEDLAKASWQELLCKGVGRDKAVTLLAAFTLARRMAREIKREMPLLDAPGAVASLVREESRLAGVEQFRVVLVNARRRLISVAKISDGTLDTILIHPREVFRPAIVGSAAAVILVHNHPSGDPTPSEADIKVTRDLIRAGQLLKIEVLDHIILGNCTQERANDFVSLRELGYFA